MFTCHFLRKYGVPKCRRWFICQPNGAGAVHQVWDKDWGSSDKSNKSRLREMFLELCLWLKPGASRLHISTQACRNTAVDADRVLFPLLKADDAPPLASAVGPDTGSAPRRDQPQSPPSCRNHLEVWWVFFFFILYKNIKLRITHQTLHFWLRKTPNRTSYWRVWQSVLGDAIQAASNGDVKGGHSVTAEERDTACAWMGRFLFFSNKPLKSV